MAIVDYKNVIIEDGLPKVDASLLVENLKTTVYEPAIVVNNRTDTAVTVVMFDTASGPTLVVNDLENEVALSKTIPANQTVVIGAGDQYLKQLIPKGTRVSIRAIGADATTGGVTLTLYGKQYKVADHRAL